MFYTSTVCTSFTEQNSRSKKLRRCNIVSTCTRFFLPPLECMDVRSPYNSDTLTRLIPTPHPHPSLKTSFFRPLAESARSSDDATHIS